MPILPASLLHSPADIIRRLLVNKGYGVDPEIKPLGAWPIYASGSPDKPDSAITVYDSQGDKQGRFMISGEVQWAHGFQLLVRAAAHGAGYAKAQALAIGMDEEVYQNTVSIGSSQYLVWSITRSGDVLAMGREAETRRYLFSINAFVTLRQIS